MKSQKKIEKIKYVRLLMKNYIYFKIEIQEFLFELLPFKRIMSVFFTVIMLMYATSSVAENLVYQLPDGTIPSYESYDRGTGISKINESYPRSSKGASSGCSGDYPRRVGAKCFRQNTCSKRKKSHYHFDGALTCERKQNGNGRIASLLSSAKQRSILVLPFGLWRYGCRRLLRRLQVRFSQKWFILLQ